MQRNRLHELADLLEESTGESQQTVVLPLVRNPLDSGAKTVSREEIR